MQTAVVKYHPILILTLVVAFYSCNNKSPIVETRFADSLLQNYKQPTSVQSNSADITFWKNRIDPNATGLVNEMRYAAALTTRFRQLGNIHDINSADSILQLVSKAFNDKETSPALALCNNAILQHRFTIADSCLDKARELGLKKYDALTASFDVDFELGRYTNAALYVQQLKPYADYGYYFRQSKLNHLNGDAEAASEAMLKAASLAGSSIYLKCAALSNAADLYMHEGKLAKAYQLYKECITLNSADYHSITGIGWIALVHDKNTTLAQQLFKMVKKNYQLPDAFFKLYQSAQLNHDSVSALQFAQSFVEEARSTSYGNMYNKYLIEIYTGILNNPQEAAAIAARELTNRSTPQTNAWYAYSLFKNGKADEAYKTYTQSVSGKPLEALELYWMGKLMQGLGKGYNAKEYFKAAAINKYDLSPEMEADLEKQLG